MRRRRPRRLFTRSALRDGAGADLTPMVDVVFLLIVFFVLVSQISSGERVEMDLPRLDEAAAPARTGQERLIINVIEGERPFVIGARSWEDAPAGLAGLTQTIRSAREEGRADRIVVRAGRAVASERALRAIRAATEAGAERIDLGGAPKKGPDG